MKRYIADSETAREMLVPDLHAESRFIENDLARAEKDRSLLVELSLPDKSEEELNFMRYDVRESVIADLAFRIREYLEENK